MRSYVVGVDLGGTKISTAVADLNGVIKSKCVIPTEAIKGDMHVLNNIYNAIENAIKEAQITVEEVKAIGIGSPGPLDSEKGIIVTTPNLPFKNFDIVNPIKEKFKVDTYLDNDANVAAIGEYMLGAGIGTKNMVYVTVSTGVGGGAILDGKIYRGATSNALEIGHTTVSIDGPICGCGNIGCLEAMSSGTAIAKRANEVLTSKLETSLRKYETVTSFEVFEEAKAGDVIANEIIDRAMMYLGVGIANIISSFDPEKVVIGGGVSKAGNVVFDKIQEVVNRRNFKIMADTCKIVPAGLGTDAGVIGAVALALLESK